jgi:hypothetical protein
VNGTKSETTRRSKDKAVAQSPEEGKVSHGVQVRLMAEPKVWKDGEVPSFTASVRNTGDKDWSIYQTQAMWALELDNVRYLWSGGVDAKSSWLSPDRQYEGIPITLVNTWQRAQDRTLLKLTHGKHTLKVICPLFSAEGKEVSPPHVEVISNPVEFEVVPTR